MLINKTFIHLNRYNAQKDLGTLIITHGMAEHSGRFEAAAKVIVEGGYNVITYDIRGHGRSQGVRGGSKSYKHFVEDLHTIVTNERKNNENIYLFGHSMGGIITHLYLIKYGKVNGAIISASPMDYILKPNLANKAMTKLLGFKKMKTNFADHKLSHEGHNLNDPLNLKYFRLSLVHQMMIKAKKVLINNYEQIDTDLLYLYGKKDLIVPFAKSKEAYEKIGSKNKQIIIYENSKHDLLHDLEKDKVIEDIINWLKEER